MVVYRVYFSKLHILCTEKNKYNLIKHGRQGCHIKADVLHTYVHNQENRDVQKPTATQNSAF